MRLFYMLICACWMMNHLTESWDFFWGGKLCDVTLSLRILGPGFRAPVIFSFLSLAFANVRALFIFLFSLFSFLSSQGKREENKPWQRRVVCFLLRNWVEDMNCGWGISLVPNFYQVGPAFRIKYLFVVSEGIKVKSQGSGFVWIIRLDMPLSVKHASRTRVAFVLLLPGILGGKKGGILYDET